LERRRPFYDITIAMITAYTANRIFTGTTWLDNHVIVVDEGVIVALLPKQNLPSAILVKDFGNCFIAPSFIDIQLYGAAGKLLAVHPTADSLFKLYDHCIKGGTTHFLPTVATNTIDVFHHCIDAVKDYWQQGGKGAIGLHVEGPWINKARRGAHIEALIHSPTLEEVQALLGYGKGVIKMITLAPEVCSIEVVKHIQSQGIIVSAGHSNASFSEGTRAFDEGIPVATHLFNAMSGFQHREPGLVGAIFQHSTVMASVIPDGHHVDFAAISIAKKMMGERLFIITDAVTDTTEGYYPHQLDGDKYVSGGILSGSAITMAQGVKNCVDKVGIKIDEALRMATLYPAKALGLHKEMGKIETGYKAHFVMLSEDLNVVDKAIDL
jgi:N-acetylglucosamine-6-phosphate deacetylase